MPNWKKLIVSGSDAALNSLNVANAVTASAFRSSNGTGTPTLISPNNIILSASNAVVIKDSVLRLDAFTNAETGSLTPQAGDLIYNSDRADVLIYTSSKWLSVLVEGDASTLPDGILSSSIQIGSDISGSFTSVSESLANRLDSTITTASAAGSTITFTKEDSSTFQVTLDSSFGDSSSANSGQVGPLITVDTNDGTLSANIITVGANIVFASDSSKYYRVNAVTETNLINEQATIRLTESVTTGRAIPDNTSANVEQNFSNVRLTGHDFLDIGTGDFVTSNYPGAASQPPDQDDEVTVIVPSIISEIEAVAAAIA